MKMNLWVVENGDGKLYDFVVEDFGDWPDGSYCYTDEKTAKRIAQGEGAHAFELVAAPKQITVSEEIDARLKLLKEALHKELSETSASHLMNVLMADNGMPFEDICRALADGWHVILPKRWYVEAPASWAPNINDPVFLKNASLDGLQGWGTRDNVYHKRCQFTQDEIDHYHLNDYEKREVPDKTEED